MLEMPLKPLSTNLTKWSNTLKQFVGKLLTNCLSVFDYFVGSVFKRLSLIKAILGKLLQKLYDKLTHVGYLLNQLNKKKTKPKLPSSIFPKREQTVQCTKKRSSEKQVVEIHHVKNSRAFIFILTCLRRNLPSYGKTAN